MNRKRRAQLQKKSMDNWCDVTTMYHKWDRWWTVGRWNLAVRRRSTVFFDTLEFGFFKSKSKHGELIRAVKRDAGDRLREFAGGAGGVIEGGGYIMGREGDGLGLE